MQSHGIRITELLAGLLRFGEALSESADVPDKQLRVVLIPYFHLAFLLSRWVGRLLDVLAVQGTATVALANRSGPRLSALRDERATRTLHYDSTFYRRLTVPVGRVLANVETLPRAKRRRFASAASRRGENGRTLIRSDCDDDDDTCCCML